MTVWKLSKREMKKEFISVNQPPVIGIVCFRRCLQLVSNSLQRAQKFDGKDTVQCSKHLQVFVWCFLQP